MNRLLWSMTMALALAAAGCVHAPNPREFSHGHEKTGAALGEVPVRGFQTTISGKPGQTAVLASMTGELIAVDDKHLWFVLERTTTLLPIHRDQIASVTIVITDSPSGAAAPLWGLLGIGSTLTHGFVLLLSAPVWLTGAITASAMIETGRRTKMQGAELNRAFQYARFPQGLPPGMGSCPKHPSTTAPAPAPTGTTPAPPAGADPTAPPTETIERQPTDPPL